MGRRISVEPSGRARGFTDADAKTSRRQADLPVRDGKSGRMQSAKNGPVRGLGVKSGSRVRTLSGLAKRMKNS